MADIKRRFMDLANNRAESRVSSMETPAPARQAALFITPLTWPASAYACMNVRDASFLCAAGKPA